MLFIVFLVWLSSAIYEYLRVSAGNTLFTKFNVYSCKTNYLLMIENIFDFHSTMQ